MCQGAGVIFLASNRRCQTDKSTDFLRDTFTNSVDFRLEVVNSFVKGLRGSIFNVASSQKQIEKNIISMDIC